MRTPKISVLIPTFNRANFIAECLDSILSQTLPPFQVLVVNDKSTDHTLEALRPYLESIEYLETPQQLGKPAALNLGLSHITGDYLWIFDDDDVALPDALARFVEPLECHPEYGFSYSPYYFTATSAVDNRIGEILSEYKIPEFNERGFLVALLEANLLGGAALFARTACYAKVGNFNELLIRSQDYEMAIRISLEFSGVRVPGKPTFHYRQHAGLRGSLQDRFQAEVRLLKWLEYDQMIFRDLYQKLPLEKYLWPGVAVEQGLRQAHLQRLAILSSKLMMPELKHELNIIAGLSDHRPLLPTEQAILERVVCYRPFYTQGSSRGLLTFFDEVRQLAKNSIVIKLIRQELVAALLREWRQSGAWKSLRQTAGVGYRILRLHFVGLPERPAQSHQVSS